MNRSQSDMAHTITYTIPLSCTMLYASIYGQVTLGSIYASIYGQVTLGSIYASVYGQVTLGSKPLKRNDLKAVCQWWLFCRKHLCHSQMETQSLQ